MSAVFRRARGEPVADLPDRYHLAALVHCIGRGRAARALAAEECAREALRRVPDRRIEARDVQRHCALAGVEIVTPEDDAYPALLRAIPDPPFALYTRGDPAAVLLPPVAVVGARRCTRGGADVAASLAAGLARAGICVISGLARGIDSAAHRAAMADGVTVGVAGSGLARLYPGGNRRLADAMVAGGGWLVSEYPPWQGARRHHFPERNRLISGMAMGVVVVEAGEHSGSLITARMAAEQGREVCAVPGPVTSPVSRGCHRLIKQGAALVESAADVLEVLGLEGAANADRGGDRASGPARPANEVLARILAAVEGTLTTLDEVVTATGVAGELASAALVELELSGFVRQVPGGYIRRPS